MRGQRQLARRRGHLRCGRSFAVLASAAPARAAPGWRRDERRLERRPAAVVVEEAELELVVVEATAAMYGVRSRRRRFGDGLAEAVEIVLRGGVLRIEAQHLGEIGVRLRRVAALERGRRPT